jgi:prolyl oligopeptidase
VFICVHLWPTSFSASAAQDDPFRYLEDANDAKAKEFFEEQGARTRAKLDAIPGRAHMAARIRALSDAGITVTAVALTPSRVFYLKKSPGHAQAVLCMRPGLSGAEREILDPARLGRGGRSASIEWFTPSPDGRHVAYGYALGGSEETALRVLAVDSMLDLPVEIDRARFNREVAWHPDSSAFYYSRYPEAGSGRRFANVRVYRHALGRDAAKDEIVFAAGVGGARDVPEFDRPSLHLPAESRYAYAVVRDGAQRELAVHVTEQRDLAAGKPHWRKLVGEEHEVIAIEAWGDDLYLLSKSGAPRHRVLQLRATATNIAAARVVVPQGDVVIESMALARDALYMRMMNGGVDRLERMAVGLLGGRTNQYVRTPFDTAIAQLVADPRMPGVVLRIQGWITPPAVVTVDPKGNLFGTSLQPQSPVDYSAMDEVRLYAPAPDGTRIPVTLIYNKSTRLTGDNPTLLVGYGAFGESPVVNFDPARLAWLERGGVYAIAHVRGGGDYGETWIAGGRRANKINTIRDFIAVAEFLVSYGFTGPKRLAIQGTRAGAIAAGGALARRPDLFAAVVGRLPMMDMVRHEAMALGPAQADEFGSAATAEGAQQLGVISAYHQLKEGTAYPAVLLTADLDDARLERWQPGKMAARLQAFTSSGRPVLLRVDRPGREDERADIYSFLLWQMGDPDFQIPPPPPPVLVGPPAPPLSPAPDTSPVAAPKAP